MNVKYLHGILYLCIAHSDVHQDLDGSDIVSDRLFLFSHWLVLCMFIQYVTRAAVFPRLPPFLFNND
jgi:hypothetical protein